MREKTFAFKITIPVLMGYLAAGCAFGLIVHNGGYPWFVALLMSVCVFAGAAQFALAALCAAGAGYVEIAVAVALINFRHLFYGLSLFGKFRDTKPYKPYLIFGLTDETYGLLTTIEAPPECSKKKTYFYITLFNQLYWIIGGLVGYFLGTIIPFDFAGVDFALTALFVVLFIEQWKSNSEKKPFAIAAACSIVALVVVGPQNMLLVSFILSIIALMAVRNKIEGRAGAC